MKRLGGSVLFVLCLAVSAYSAIAYGLLPLSSLRLHPELKASFVAHEWGLRFHVLAAIAALALGPLQFVSRLRARWPAIHRWMGRIYLGVGVGIGGLSGLYMAQHAFGGVGPRIGFTLLALAWLYTGYRGYRAIREGNVARHREWMLANFSLTLAAVTLRIQLFALMSLGLPFEVAYPPLAWSSWIPNILVAGWWIRRARSQGAGTTKGPAPDRSRPARTTTTVAGAARAAS